MDSTVVMEDELADLIVSWRERGATEEQIADVLDIAVIQHMEENA